MTLSELLRHYEKKFHGILTVQPQHPAFAEWEDFRLQPDQDLHHGDVCRAAKLGGEIPVCAKRKKIIRERAEKGAAFYDVCPFGLMERIVPVLFHGTLAAVLYFGHFLPESGAVLLPGGKAWNIPRMTPELRNDVEHACDFIAEYLRIGMERWIAEGGLERKKKNGNFYLDNLNLFVENNFTKNVALSELAERLRMSPNYLGARILELTGRTFRKHLNSRRIRESEIYLGLHREWNIGEIAAACGFPDSNYFSVVFRKEHGCSPSEFRREKMRRKTEKDESR